MNKYIVGGLVSAMALSSFVACDVMDTKPFETYDEDLVWGSKNTADAFVFETYNSAVTLFNGRAYTEGWTPNCIHSDLMNLDGFPIERFDRYHDSGFSKFGALRRCNQIIEKSASSLGLSDGQKNELIAEGHMLRGLIYFYQAQRMGRFVPVQRVLAPTDTIDFKVPLTSSPAESYELIMADFDKAIDGLPEESASGRLNKYAALAFKSQACLQAYAYTMDEKYLDACIAASDAVINSGKYILDSNYGDMFLSAGKYSKEIILGYYRLDKNTNFGSFSEMINMVPNLRSDDIRAANAGPLFKEANGQTFEGWASYFPTQDLVDQYLVIDKKDGKAKVWDETSQFKASVINDITNLSIGSYTSESAKVPNEGDMSGSNSKGDILDKAGQVIDYANISELMYENRDKRFYGSIVYDSCKWIQDELITTCCLGNAWAGVRVAAGASQDDSWYTTASGYYWRKGVYEVSPRMIVSSKTDYHFVLKRLGEMYLNRAEAYLLKGNVTAAVENLNVTRMQHGGLPASEANTLEEAWNDYIRERRVELALENDTYWSYLRWGKYGGSANEGKAPGAPIEALNKPVHKIQISKDRKRFFTAQILRNGAWERTFTEKRYLLPIPQGQIDKRAASGIIDTQNLGW
ncbi:MAG TPA: RagB/SusD family nutrient uptake outer membrane protein [Porphyromonadaceae bacterium]|nr:RagB/SusD family nutrient uptake outer membrane protein [Porphyromonadaceae bacterium]